MLTTHDTRSPNCAAVSAYGLMDLFHLDENAIIEDGMDENGNLDTALTFKDLLSTDTSFFLHDFERTEDVLQTSTFEIGMESSLQPFKTSGVGTALELFMEERDDSDCEGMKMEGCLSGSKVIGSFKSTMNHKRLCKNGGRRKKCCQLMVDGAELDFQVEQSPTSCDCKKNFWISIRQLPTFEEVGRMIPLHSDILSPLILAGYVTICGRLCSSKNGSDFEYEITVLSNLEFVLLMIESVTLKHVEAFCKLRNALQLNDNMASKFNSFVENLENCGAAAPVAQPPCMKCKVAERTTQNISRKRLRPRPCRSSSDYGSTDENEGSCTSMIKNMLEERRRKRAREQMANCTEKDVAQFQDAINLESDRAFEKTARFYQGDLKTACQALHDYMDDILQRVLSGKNAVGGLGELLGVTKALCEEKITWYRDVNAEWEEAFRIWRSLLEGRSDRIGSTRILGRPLARFVCKLLMELADKLQDDECMCEFKNWVGLLP